MQSMKFIPPFLLLPFLFTLSVWSASPVPYSGKIDIRGVNYFGEAQFAFSLHDGNGTTHWRNGKQPGETIKVTIRNGRYSVLLGGQGMNSLPPELFLKHDKLYLKVEFDNEDGEGLRHLAPDQLITATPRALVADIAKLAKVAQVAEKVGNGAITRDMLSSEVLAQLDANATASPSTPITITRDMLPASVLNDLNKPVTITRDMLPQDVRDDLNKTVTITRNMLSADVLADLNKSSTTAPPITLSMLAPEVTAKLDQNGSGGSGVVVGSLISVPYGESAPAGYSLYQRGTPKNELVWEEKAPVSVGRWSTDGVEVFNGEIYFLGGKNTSVQKIVERYKPAIDSWETLSPMSIAREGSSCAVLAGKIYAIGGMGLTSVEIYDPATDTWSNGTALPSVTERAYAIVVNGLIYLVGGRNDSGQEINQVLCFNPSANQWTTKANMPTSRHGAQLVWFENRIWTIGGHASDKTNKVESYDPSTDSWQTETSLKSARQWPVAWVANGRIYVGGGSDGVSYLNSVEVYDPATRQWSSVGNFPENKYVAGMVVLNDKAYVIGGYSAVSVFSNKVFAADLNASVAGVYDLYRKDGNASAGTPVVQAEVADGSVTTAKLNATILKYLKPEITTQPQAQIVYADSNASFSVTAEGKYLTYQWKKDGGNLTGETNATLTITDANATLHDGNYSVVVSNDFGSVESGVVEVKVSDALMNGLVGWWKFDEGSGVVAYDSSGNGNDGNLTNGPTWTSGKIGGALSFDGVDDFVVIPATSDLDLQTLSIFSWVYSSNYIQDGFIFEKTTNGFSNTQYNLFLWNNNKIYLRTKPPNAGSEYEGDLRTDTNLSSWNLISGTYDGASKKIYINSNMVASMSWSSPVDTNPNGISKIGAYSNSSGGSDYCFNGKLDDIRIYNRALSAAEVQALYNSGQ
jgi:N-acetylneuraminic acid mutarotase